MDYFMYMLLIPVVILIWKGIRIVPQGQEWEVRDVTLPWHRVFEIDFRLAHIAGSPMSVTASDTATQRGKSS